MAEWSGYPYFTKREMMCRCGCGGLPPDRFMFKLVSLRHECEFPFIISSGYRCPRYNVEIGGTPNGPHTKGASDILLYHERALIVVELARQHGMTGIGVKQVGDIKKRFIHLDDIDIDTVGFTRSTIWSYGD